MPLPITTWHAIRRLLACATRTEAQSCRALFSLSQRPQTDGLSLPPPADYADGTEWAAAQAAAGTRYLSTPIRSLSKFRRSILSGWPSTPGNRAIARPGGASGVRAGVRA